MQASASTRQSAGSGRAFGTTHWTVILAARDDSESQGAALEELCQGYWLPVYAYIRHRGLPEEEARDLTQSFFLRFIDRQFLRQVDPAKGRFRSFMMVAVNHHLANERDRALTVKRGGRITFVPLDAETTAGPVLRLRSSEADPLKAYERGWALTVMNRAWECLRAEFCARHDGGHWTALAPHLSADDEAPAYATTAQHLGRSIGAVKMAVRRLRQRYAELVRDEVARTVTTPGDIEAEIRHFRQVLAR
jgi:RNA polymerase sigma-70 factor (ECF subfamily)